MEFNSPEIQKMTNRDQLFLSQGKIDWESQLLKIAEEVSSCYKRLSWCESDINEFDDECSVQTKSIDQVTNEIDNLLTTIVKESDDKRKSALSHKLMILQSLKNAKQRLTMLLGAISDSDRNNTIERLVNAIKDWQTNDNQYSWKDVALSMLKHPENIVLDYDRCPKCSTQRLKIRFYSPEWTWAMMCGIGFDMVICPECKSQIKTGGLIIRS